MKWNFKKNIALAGGEEDKFMFKFDKDKEERIRPERGTIFSLKSGLSVIWRFLAYGLAFDIFMFLITIPVIAFTLIFAPDKVLQALQLFK